MLFFSGTAKLHFTGILISVGYRDPLYMIWYPNSISGVQILRPLCTRLMFPFDPFFQGIFRRYPNPFATHVLSEDTLYRELRPNGILYSRRLVTKTNRIPKWGERFLVNFKRMVPLIEESYIDREKRTIVTYTRNVGLSTFMTAVEKVSYVPNPENPIETVAIKEAWYIFFHFLFD